MKYISYSLKKVEILKFFHNPKAMPPRTHIYIFKTFFAVRLIEKFKLGKSLVFF